MSIGSHIVFLLSHQVQDDKTLKYFQYVFTLLLEDKENTILDGNSTIDGLGWDGMGWTTGML